MVATDNPSFSGPAAEGLRAGAITLRLLGEEIPVRFAAAELLRYLPRLLPGRPLEVWVGTAAQMSAAGLSEDSLPSEGTTLVRGDGHRYLVSGGGPAAVLHAAYTLLESLGARWPAPDPRTEVIRPLEGPPPVLSLISTPAFARRGLTDGCLSWWPGTAPFQGWLEEMRGVVDWMGKMRMNRLFVHFNRLLPGDLSPLLLELESRGIELELGGHSLPKLLPPGAREADPELCRMVEGERRPDGNFCTSNPRTLDLLREEARHFALQLPPADLYHLWSYDAKVDPWCSCPDCAALSGDEQMWRAVAAAAEGVGTARPGARISGLLYHESLGAADGAPEGMGLLFAPRERCYLHPIDGDCARNRGYLQDLREAVDRRGGDLSLLEYYGDPILFGRPANRPDMVASDLAAYRAEGVRNVSTLVFGALSWWLYPLQLYAYARGSWDPAEAGVAAADYCRSVAGEAGGELLARYYRLEGEAAGTHLRFCGYGEDGSWATLPFPPAEPVEEVARHRAELERGELLLREARGLLDRVAAGSAGIPRLMDALQAHRLEEAFHRAVVARLAEFDQGTDGRVGATRPIEMEAPVSLCVGATGGAAPVPSDRGVNYREAFAEAVAAMEEARPEALGVFGVHWMLPWLRRCRDLGHDAPL